MTLIFREESHIAHLKIFDLYAFHRMYLLEKIWDPPVFTK